MLYCTILYSSASHKIPTYDRVWGNSYMRCAQPGLTFQSQRDALCHALQSSGIKNVPFYNKLKEEENQGQYFI